MRSVLAFICLALLVVSVAADATAALAAPKLTGAQLACQDDCLNAVIKSTVKDEKTKFFTSYNQCRVACKLPAVADLATGKCQVGCMTKFTTTWAADAKKFTKKAACMKACSIPRQAANGDKTKNRGRFTKLVKVTAKPTPKYVMRCGNPGFGTCQGDPAGPCCKSAPMGASGYYCGTC